MAASTPSPELPAQAPAVAGSHGDLPHGQPHGQQHGQQHPIGLYLKIWALLFVLSTLSYLVDYFHFEGYLRWTLILLFMVMKAGLIVAVFMHMAWERLALICAILLPPLCLLVLVGLMAAEADYTFLLRGVFFR
ncbi:cytochrome C oxidase subunit IV family protein [Cupriavidus basilensis]|uniref:cytochrome C oxidase subunit IV family protein n=1 Tax=Cupriavidus basilensis TaxID=68895 RepID=UPI001F50557E|nr:cytochrome C oxidase subunit IV family protein [Cupriavidus basilensis]MCP3018990.1 cytochrome C oxidase subunit IV family protein [Cupriavidus basilensis]MDR3381925.1 cytochrome C oxidase subunit IV family protein [Cupriavidus basilensis]